MSSVEEIRGWLEARLPEMLEEYGVPGASVAVLAHDATAEVAAGAVNLATGLAATTDAIFQVGSITKVFTATLIMQLVDEGLLGLDDPVRRVLPEFRLADDRAAARITIRQLLSHSAGFEGDIFTDTGSGEDCLERYAASLADTPQLFAPGVMFSYNNAAFCVLGRVIEVLRGAAFDACLRRHLLAPLGLDGAALDASEAILQRAAVGHLAAAEGAPLEVAPVWAMARSNAPAGSMLAMRARDLIAFARMHLAKGRAANGAAVLSVAGALKMQRPQCLLPEIHQGTAWGLGWELFDRVGGLVIGHDGSTIGQAAMLRVVPGAGVAVAALANGGSSRKLFAEIADRVLSELAGIAPVPAPEPGPGVRPPERPERYLGRYGSSTSEVEVTRDANGRVWLRRTPLGDLADAGDPVYRTELVAWHGDVLLPVTAEGGVHQPVAFLGDAGAGRALYAHTGRADRRADA